MDEEEKAWGIAKVVLILLVATFLWYKGCKPGFEEFVKEDRIDIVDIWMHEPGDYSISYYVGYEYVTRRTVSHSYCTAKILEDLEPGQNMYYEYHLTFTKASGPCDRVSNVNVIHKAKDYRVRGSGWNHGKFGRGQTIRVN